jgi:hypothetical protein
MDPMKIRIAAVVLAALAVGSCGSARVGGGFCDVQKPYIFASDAEREATPPGPKRYIVGTNRRGGELCGWKPGR